jgi:hypothetical protein
MSLPKQLFFCGSENCTINKRDSPSPTKKKRNEAKISILRQLLGLKTLHRQRNANIPNKMQINTIVKDSEENHKNWLDHLKRMDKNLLPRLDLQ